MNIHDIGGYLDWFVYLALIVSSMIVVIYKGNTVKISRGVLGVYAAIFILLGIFAYFTADWNSYEEFAREQYISKINPVTNQEPFWRRLAFYLKGNIYLLRAFTYGLSFIVLFYYLVHFVPKERQFLTLILYIFFGLHSAIGGRQTLSILLFYLAFMLFSKSIIYKIIGLAIIICCIPLHKGTILFFPVLVVSCVYPSKKVIILTLTSAAIITVLFPLYFEKVMLNYFPDFQYLYYLAFDMASHGSRRDIYLGMINRPIVLLFNILLLITAFKLPLSAAGRRYRTFFYYGLLLYCVLYFTNFNADIRDRWGSMLKFPIILLVSEIVALRNKRVIVLKKALYAYAAIQLIFTNISISGVLGIGKF